MNVIFGFCQIIFSCFFTVRFGCLGQMSLCVSDCFRYIIFLRWFLSFYWVTWFLLDLNIWVRLVFIRRFFWDFFVRLILWFFFVRSFSWYCFCQIDWFCAFFVGLFLSDYFYLISCVELFLSACFLLSACFCCQIFSVRLFVLEPSHWLWMWICMQKVLKKQHQIFKNEK